DLIPVRRCLDQDRDPTKAIIPWAAREVGVTVGEERVAFAGIGSQRHHRHRAAAVVDNGCYLGEDLPPDEEVATWRIVGALDIGQPRDDRLHPLEGDLSEVGHPGPYLRGTRGRGVWRVGGFEPVVPTVAESGALLWSPA